MRKGAGFICQINPESLRVISWQTAKGKPAVVRTEIESLVQGLNDDQISERLTRLFKKLALNKEPIIICLPRILATCCCLKLPSDEPAEIERMAKFQASRYLPYPANELITGFSVIRRDPQSYSYVNLIIVHTDVVERFLKILKSWREQVQAILLSSYALVYWYRSIKPKQTNESTMILNIDLPYVEIAIACQGNLLFSRAFKLPENKLELHRQFTPLEKITDGVRENSLTGLTEQIDKTLKSYQKETGQTQPTKIILTGLEKELLENIKNLELNLPIEYIAGNPLAAIAEQKIESCLNLLPPGEKEKKKRLSLRKEYLRIICLILGIIVFLFLGVLTAFHNKIMYLNRLKQELKKISPQVKAIEDMEKRTTIISAQVWQMPKVVDVLYEVYRFLPKEISLITLIYEENSQVVLRGQTKDLSAVFNAISIFEKSELFCNVKVRYATTKKTQGGVEVVDFEIVCPLRR